MAKFMFVLTRTFQLEVVKFGCMSTVV